VDDDEDDGLDDGEDAVFRALADRGRRALLDALVQSDGQTLSSLCEVLPEMTRFGVMKHLAVLEEAGLVITHRAGRSKLHYLNAVPIQELADRWIAKYARPTATAMAGLRRQLET
jgi:DNA-binding transcriptional ArsR family regulator